MAKSMRLGGGGRFAAIEAKAAASGARNPAAVAAAAGRKKYGGAKMAKMAAAGRMRSHMPPGVPKSPEGDIGIHRQKESRRVGGGFKDTHDVSAYDGFKN